MTLNEIRKIFTVSEKAPKREMEKGLIYCAEVVIEGNKGYWVIFETRADFLRFQYLQSPNDYKVKEELFGIDYLESFSYIRKPNEAPRNISLVLPEKWEIRDKNIKRSFSVVLQSLDEDNDQLLHDLYTKARGKKGE